MLIVTRNSYNKQVVSLSSNKIEPETLAHIARVQADGGTVDSIELCNTYFVFKKNNAYMADVLADAMPHVLGYKPNATNPYLCLKIYSSLPSGIGDLAQTNGVIYQPLLLKYQGERYYYSSNSSYSNLKSNKDSDTGDFDIKAKIEWNGGTNVLVGKHDGSGATEHFTLSITTAGNIQIVFANTHTYTSTATIGSTYTGHVRVTRQASSGEIKFYTSTNGSTWNQLGSTITGITTVYTAQAYLQVGSYWNGSASLSFNGKIYTLTYSDTINGTPTESIDLTSYNAAVSQTTWTSTTGETWTLIKPTANNIYYSSVVVRTTVQLRFGYNWLETSLNPLPLGNITQMNLGSINAAPASSGGSIFRSALVQTRDGFYYNYSIFTGSENSDEILNSYFTTFSPIIKHGINVLNYKTQFFTQRVQSGVSCKVYLNNNLLTTGNTSAWLAYNITRIGGYGAFTLNQNNNGVFTFNSLLSEANTFAFQSFVNTSLMNNELW